MGHVPYHYGDLNAHLHTSGTRPSATGPVRTTGMVFVPAVFALFGLGMFSCLACGAFHDLRSGDIGAGVVMLLYASLTIPYMALPLISIRNFLRRHKSR